MTWLLLAACTRGDDTGDQPPVEQRWEPFIAVAGEGELKAGAAAVSITPDCFESFVDLDGDAEFDKDEELLDCGCDRLCPEDEGYTGPDEGEGDGEHQVVWMAGFQNNRPAQGVHDDLWARALVLDQGDVRIGIVTVDLVGWFHQEAVATRELAADRGLDLDHILVVATHNHEGPDTVGMWGKTESKNGFDRDYGDLVVEHSVDALEQAVAALTVVDDFVVGSADVRDFSDQGALNLLRDARDPKVIDPNLGAAIFRDGNGDTIATLAHFGNHPEAMADENGLLTSDYVDGLRKQMEEDFGGTSLFITGTVGGMMTPLGVTHIDAEGTEWREYTHERAELIGREKARIAKSALDNGQTVPSPQLKAAATIFYLPVENYAFQAGFLSGILERQLFNYDTTLPIGRDNVPEVLTEMDYIAIGPLEMLSIPGEPLPELAVGGYDGSLTGHSSEPIVDEGNPNPPDLSQAPEGPYLKDLLSGEHRWIVGMGNDELGYMIPPYNFKLDETVPWFDEAEGDHYEETNSLGPNTAPLVMEEAVQLMDWVSANL
jgi:hypothetical protein